MIVLEITRNGKKVVTAGAANLEAINAGIDAFPDGTGKLNVFGIAEAKPGFTQQIATWKECVHLAEGDEIVIRIKNADKADPYEQIEDPLERG